MIAVGPITIRCRLLENGNLFLWGIDEDGTRTNPHVLKRQMFTWHAKSFYGATVQTVESEGVHGVTLTPYLAADYFASPAHSIHTEIHWGEGAASLLKKAARIMECLRHGWYAPSYEKWQSGRWGWKLLVPSNGEEQVADSNDDETILGNENDWLDRILTEMVKEHPKLSKSWTDAAAVHPMLTLRDIGLIRYSENGLFKEHADEEEWLIAIGWKTDDAPFRCGVRLSEPEEDGAWKLDIVLQEKENVKRILEYADGDGIPESWIPFLPDRIHRAISKLQRRLTWLDQLPQGSAEAAVRGRAEQPDLGSAFQLSDEQAWQFLEESSMELAQAGYTVFLPAWWEEVRKLKPKLKAVVKSSVGGAGQSLFGLEQLMQFDWKIAVGELDLTEEQFRQLASSNKRLLQFGNRWIHLNPALLKQIQQLMQQVAKKGLSFRDVLKSHLLVGAEASAGLSQQELADDSEIAPLQQVRIEVQLNEQLAGMIEQLNHNRQIPLLDVSDRFQGHLRGYQAAGSSWLHFLRRFGMGACLADDMGLGKTVQFISYLLHVKETENPSTPSLLICPTSVMGNWQKELERFAPDLSVYVHYGSQRVKDQAMEEVVGSSDLVLTTYALAHMDEAALSSITWSAVCLDEAQNIKNVYTKQSTAVRKLKANHRIALTGTPVENRLTELWSIFDFINPGYLGTLPAFTRNYVTAIEKSNDEERIGQVQQLVRPFMLRRTKKDPAIQLDLPEKNESNVYIPLTAEQGSLYEQIAREMLDNIEHKSAMERRGLILATITKLKQLCNHPSLLLKDVSELASIDQARSNKVIRLLEMIEELREEGDRCLIFTQYAEMGNLLKRMLDKIRQEPVYFLHGGVPKKSRDRMIASFQDTSLPAAEHCGIFILSLKAGGTGLNLTAANHVFHFDRWWNPAVENQATDRAYRIGQSRDVQVHKFVSLGTLEERIDEMITRKQNLNQQIVGSDNWITELSTGELKELFRLRKEWIDK